MLCTNEGVTEPRPELDGRVAHLLRQCRLVRSTKVLSDAASVRHPQQTTSLHKWLLVLRGVYCSRALGVSTLSYAWWMFTNKEYQYSNIFDFLLTRMLKKRYKAGGLDENRLAEAQVSAKGPTSVARIMDLGADLVPYTNVRQYNRVVMRCR